MTLLTIHWLYLATSTYTPGTPPPHPRPQLKQCELIFNLTFNINNLAPDDANLNKNFFIGVGVGQGTHQWTAPISSACIRVTLNQIGSAMCHESSQSYSSSTEKCRVESKSVPQSRVLKLSLTSCVVHQRNLKNLIKCICWRYSSSLMFLNFLQDIWNSGVCEMCLAPASNNTLINKIFV